MTALAVAGETRLVPLMTCETVETETPASRATSAIVDTSPPAFLAVAPRDARLFPGQASRSKRLRNRFDTLVVLESAQNHADGRIKLALGQQGSSTHANFVEESSRLNVFVWDLIGG